MERSLFSGTTQKCKHRHQLIVLAATDDDNDEDGDDYRATCNTLWVFTRTE